MARSRNANFIEILPLLSFRGDNDIRGARIMQRYPKRKIAVSINAVTQRGEATDYTDRCITVGEETPRGGGAKKRKGASHRGRLTTITITTALPAAPWNKFILFLMARITAL